MKMMRKVILAGSFAFGMFAFSPAMAHQHENTHIVIAQATEMATFHVKGKCGMCKNRIESAVKSLEGVESANWDKDTKEFTVVFEAAKLTEEKIHERIASVGHDTEKVKASEEVYNALPGCCKYERSAK